MLCKIGTIWVDARCVKLIMGPDSDGNYNIHLEYDDKRSNIKILNASQDSIDAFARGVNQALSIGR